MTKLYLPNIRCPFLVDDEVYDYVLDLENRLEATNDRKPVNELIKKYEGWLDFAVKKHSLPSFQNIVTMIIKDLKGLAL